MPGLHQEGNGYGPRNNAPALSVLRAIPLIPAPTLHSWGSPGPDPSSRELGPLPQSLRVGKHPLSESQIQVPRKEERLLEPGRNHVVKEFEPCASKETREPKELVNPEETESNQKTQSDLPLATSSGYGGP